MARNLNLSDDDGGDSEPYNAPSQYRHDIVESRRVSNAVICI